MTSTAEKSTTPLVKLTSSEILLLLALGAVQFTHIMDFMIIMPLGPQLMRSFSIDAQRFSLIVSAYTFAAGIASFLGSLWLDRVSRKKALSVAYTGFVAGTLCCALAPNYLWLLAARAVTGAFGGVSGSLVFAMAGDSVEARKRGRAMGIVMASFSLASVMGVPVGLQLATWFSWHAPFVALVVAGIFILALIQWRVPALPPPDRGAHGPFDLYREILGTPREALSLLFSFFSIFGHFLMIPLLSQLFVGNAGFPESKLSLVYLFGGLVTLFTAPLVGRFSDRFGAAQVFSWAAFLYLLPVWLLAKLWPMSVPALLCITTLFFVASNSRMVPSMALITSAVDTRRRGGFMSLNAAVQQLGTGLGSLVAGLLIVTGSDGHLYHYERLALLATVANVFCWFLVQAKLKKGASLAGSPPLAH